MNFKTKQQKQQSEGDKNKMNSYISIRDITKTELLNSKEQARELIQLLEDKSNCNCTDKITVSFKNVTITLDFLQELIDYIKTKDKSNIKLIGLTSEQQPLLEEALKVQFSNQKEKRNTYLEEPTLIKLESKQVNNFLNTYEATYELSSGHQKVYEIISRDKELTLEKFTSQRGKAKTDGVGIIAFRPAGDKILIIKEFRMACGEWIYTFPGGLIGEGETSYRAAIRELKEETGLDLIKTIKMLPQAYTAVGIRNETVKTVICLADGEIKPSTSLDEQIEARWYTKEEVKKLLEKNKPMSLRTQTFLWMWASGLNL